MHGSIGHRPQRTRRRTRHPVVCRCIGPRGHDPRRGRGLYGPRRVDARYAVHRRDGLPLPLGPRARPTGGRRDHHDHRARGWHVPGLRAHEGLGRALAGARHTRPLPGRRRGEAPRADLRHVGGDVGLAARRHGRAAGRRGHARPARPDRIQRPLRLHRVHHGGRRAAERGGRAARVATQDARPPGRTGDQGTLRPRRHRRRLFRHGQCARRGPHGAEGGARAEPAGARRQRVERGPRVGDGPHPPREVSAHRRDRRGVLRPRHEEPGHVRGVRGRQEGADRPRRTQHRPLPRHACLRGRARRRPHRERHLPRHPHEPRVAVHGTLLLRCHRPCGHRPPRRRRNRHGGEGADGHEQHVGLGGAGHAADLPRDALGAAAHDGRLSLSARPPRPVVLGERLRQGPARRRRGHPRLEPAGGLRRIQRHEERRRRRRPRDRRADVGGGDRGAAREPADPRRRRAHAGRHRGQAGVSRRLRPLDLVDRPALSQGGVREEVSGQSVHLDRRARPPRRPLVRLPRPVSLLLFQGRRKPLHGGPLHLGHARGARHRARHEDLRHDGRGRGQGGERGGQAGHDTARRLRDVLGRHGGAPPAARQGPPGDARRPDRDSRRRPAARRPARPADRPRSGEARRRASRRGA